MRWVCDLAIASAQYTISKHAQARLCEMMALQYRDEGISVFDVHPGGVMTEMAMTSKGAEVFYECKPLRYLHMKQNCRNWEGKLM